MWKVFWLVVAGAVVMSLHGMVARTEVAIDRNRAIECAVSPELAGCDEYATASGAKE